MPACVALTAAISAIAFLSDRTPCPPPLFLPPPLLFFLCYTTFAGTIKGFTGIDDPYEEPLAPEVVITTGGKAGSAECRSPEAMAGDLLEYLESNGYLSA